MNISKEYTLLTNIKTALEKAGFKVFINEPETIIRGEYVYVMPIDTEYDYKDGVMNVLISVNNVGGTAEKRLQNVIESKNTIRKALMTLEGARYIQIKKENYTVDVNKKVLYLQGVDMEFEIGILNEGGNL